MPTFDSTYGSQAMFSAVALEINRLQEQEGDALYIHTVHLELDGQHGEFNLTIDASDDTEGFLEDRKWTGVAHRSGGVAGLQEVEI